jgi:DNA-binding NarL/FixJ family response regulator
VATTLIVDDDLDMRSLLRHVIERADGALEVVGEAADGDEALAVYLSLGPPEQPDVVVLDYRMPRMSGLELARKILARFPGQAVILLSSFLDADTKREAVELGVAACVAKDDVEKLPAVIRAVASRPAR